MLFKAKLILSVKKTFKYTDDTKFKSLLMQVKILDVNVFAALYELHATFLDTEYVFLCLQSLANNDEQCFIELYSDALSQSVIEVQDNEMILKLREITAGFTETNIVKILRVSCESANNYKRMAKIFREYCHGLDEDKSLLYISEGSN